MRRIRRWNDSGDTPHGPSRHLLWCIVKPTEASSVVLFKKKDRELVAQGANFEAFSLRNLGGSWRGVLLQKLEHVVGGQGGWHGGVLEELKPPRQGFLFPSPAVSLTSNGEHATGTRGSL